MQKTIVFVEEKTFEISLEKMWSLLAETNQLNQYIGLFPVQFSPFTEDETSLIRHSEATALGFIKTVWNENVFEWVRHQHYSIERNYLKGPVTRAVWEVVLEATGDCQTTVRLHGRFTVPNYIGQVALKLVIIPQLKRTFHYAFTFQQDMEMRPLSTKTKSAIQVQQNRLSLLITKLRELFNEDHMIDQLVRTLKFSDTDEVTVCSLINGRNFEALIGEKRSSFFCLLRKWEYLTKSGT